MSDHQTIDVAISDAGPARAYQVHVGANLLENAGALLGAHLARPKTVIVTDANVKAAQGARLSGSLAAAGVQADEIVLAPGEATKSFAQLEALSSQLLQLGVERQDLIIAFGGGVIGDLVGLAAALLRRGCRFAQIPTTLLAQVDSSVGGKTAINAAEGKNLIGAFHQPAIVIADTATLSTLPDREQRAGYAEVVKYAAIGDSEFFAWLEAEAGAVLSGDRAALRHAVTQSVSAKARIVAADEREAGARALLNFGHTFGHALEAAFGYGDALIHGEGVAAGMGLAFDYSVAQGLCQPDDAAQFKAHLSRHGLPTGLHDLPTQRDWRADELLALMRQDKKVKAGALTLILARKIGAAFIADDVDESTLMSFLHQAGAA